MVHVRRRIKRFLLNLFYRKLWVQIALILLLLVSIPLTTLGIILINTSQQAIRKSVLKDYQEIATRASGEIELFISRSKDILTTASAMFSVVYPAPWKQETLLVEIVLNQPIVIRAASVDLSGRQIASSELGRGLQWDYPRDILTDIRQNREYISEVKFLDNHTPYMTMATPITKMGKITGALVADINLRGIWDIVDNIKIGQTGRAFLVSGDGTLIAHQDKKRVLKKENLAGQKDVQAVLGGKTESIEFVDELGKDWISAYGAVYGLGWGIVLRQEQSEAYLFSKVMKMQSWAIILVSELIVILVSIFMAQILIHPIKILVTRTKRVAAGDLDHKIKMRRRDEIGQLIRSFNDMTVKLKAAKARERFLAIGEAAAWIAHELKNSLVSIKSFVQLFPLKHTDGDFVRRFSKLVPDEIYRWERMLKELSDFSSHSELHIVKTNVGDLINLILEMMVDRFSQKQIAVKYIRKNPNLYLMADPERLKQVFINLIINAINAMPQGGSLTISAGFIYSSRFATKIHPTTTADSPAYIEVRIKDTGRGIPSEVLDKVFEPFHTNTENGIGLGLSICRRITEQHGGKIEVESQMGVGTAFVIRLPLTYQQQSNVL